MRQIRLAPIAALLLLFETVAVAQEVATEAPLDAVVASEQGKISLDDRVRVPAAAVQPAQAPARPGAFFPPDEPSAALPSNSALHPTPTAASFSR